jgi:hypothetical protein
MWDTSLLKGRVHLSHLIAAKKAETVCISGHLTPLHSYMPKFMDMAKLPPHLQKLSPHGSDESGNAPTTVTTTSSSKKHSHSPGKNVNYGSIRHNQDTSDQSPATSSSASTITCTDDWDLEDGSSLRDIVNDPANERLIAQLMALVAATSIGQPPRAPASQQHRPFEKTRTAYGDREVNDVKSSLRTTYRDTRDTRAHRSDVPIGRACYNYFVHGTCPRADHCRYSHDKDVVNDARLACMTK